MMGFEMELSDQEVRTLYYAVCEAIRLWPGYPARPLQEQEELYYLKTQLFRMVAEMNFEA